MQNGKKLRGFKLILTSECNFRCTYCCQNDKKSGAMSWEIARTAINRLLGSGEEEVELSFCGGEPLLQLPLIRRSVEYALEQIAPNRKIGFAISTNGSLLTDDTVSFLAEHRFQTQLSFDGVQPAQDLRKRGTFETLHERLRSIRRNAPSYFRDLLTLSLTVTPENLSFLPQSIDYFLREDVRHIRMAPLFTPIPREAKIDLDCFEQVFDRVARSSIRHFKRTGLVPIALFGKWEVERRPAGSSIHMCGIRNCSYPSVDVNGEVSGCVALVRSMQATGSTRFGELLHSLTVGRVESARLDEDRARFRSRIDREAAFIRKEEKESSFKKCGECEFFDQCTVCPVALTNDREMNDARRVPDFYCAFNRASFTAAKRFPISHDPAVLSMGGGGMREQMEEFLERTGMGR